MKIKKTPENIIIILGLIGLSFGVFIIGKEIYKNPVSFYVFFQNIEKNKAFFITVLIILIYMMLFWNVAIRMLKEVNSKLKKKEKLPQGILLIGERYKLFFQTTPYRILGLNLQLKYWNLLFKKHKKLFPRSCLRIVFYTLNIVLVAFILYLFLSPDPLNF